MPVPISQHNIFNEGEVPQTLRLNGIDDHLSLPGTEDITYAFINGFTLTGIVKAEELIGYQHLFSKEVTSHGTVTNRSFGLYYDLNFEKLVMEIFDLNGSATGEQVFNSNMVVGVDLFFAVAYDPTTGSLNSYVNGVYHSSFFAHLTLNTSAVPVTIGSITGDNPQQLKGEYKHFSIWKRVLSQAEMISVASRSHKQAGQLLSTGTTGYTSPDCLFYSTLQHTSTSVPVNLASTTYTVSLNRVVPVVGMIGKRVSFFNGKLRTTNSTVPVIKGLFTMPADGLRAWFKSDETTDYELNANGFVSRWIDHSPNLNDALPRSFIGIGVQPNIIGTQSALYVQPGSAGLQTTNTIGIATTDSSTFFIVIKYIGTGAQAAFGYGQNGGRNLFEGLLYFGRFIVANYGVDYNTNIQLNDSNGIYILEVRKQFEFNQIQFYNKGTPGTTLSPSGDTTPDTLMSIGGGNNGNFNSGGLWVAEFIAYNRGITDVENTSINSYLFAKYGVTAGGSA